MRLRFAEHEDIPQCVEVGREFWAVSPYAESLEYSPESVAGLLATLIDNQLMMVAEYEEGIVGVAGIWVAPLPFNPAVILAHELFWYVAPGVRENGVGAAMLSNIESMARAKGAKLMSMGTMQTSSPEKAEKLFSAHDYKLTEKTYTKVL